MKRIAKEFYYLSIAHEVARRSTCLRRKFGAVIVHNDQIVSTGYCGAPRGTINCSDAGKCLRKEMDIPSGHRYELCRSVHAEMNAVISPSRTDMLGSTLYLVGLDAETGALFPGTEPCRMCKRVIINAGIYRVIAQTDPEHYIVWAVEDWVSYSLGEFVRNEHGLTPVLKEGL